VWSASPKAVDENPDETGQMRFLEVISLTQGLRPRPHQGGVGKNGGWEYRQENKNPGAFQKSRKAK
jgi:hypothetical protein